MYNGKNRTPYVKDAFHDHIIPSHRPAEPEPERDPSALPMKKSSAPGSPVAVTKSPKLPGMTVSDDAEGEEGNDEAEANGEATTNGEGDKEHIVTPPPRPTSTSGGRQFVNPDKTGTKAGAHYSFKDVPGKGGCVVVRLKLTPSTVEEDPAILDEELFDDIIEERRVDADEFYGQIARGALSDDLRNIMRQALGGMMWNKQYYQYIQKEWMDGDPGQPPPPPERKWVRNRVSRVRIVAKERAHGRNGSTCTSTTSCPCRTSGSTRGSRRELRMLTCV